MQPNFSPGPVGGPTVYLSGGYALTGADNGSLALDYPEGVPPWRTVSEAEAALGQRAVVVALPPDRCEGQCWVLSPGTENALFPYGSTLRGHKLPALLLGAGKWGFRLSQEWYRLVYYGQSAEYHYSGMVGCVAAARSTVCKSLHLESFYQSSPSGHWFTWSHIAALPAYFHLDGFLTAMRCCLDGIARVLRAAFSVRGCESSIRGCVKKGLEPNVVWEHVTAEWDAWAKALVDHRDFLTHTAPLAPAGAADGLKMTTRAPYGIEALLPLPLNPECKSSGRADYGFPSPLDALLYGQDSLFRMSNLLQWLGKECASEACRQSRH